MYNKLFAKILDSSIWLEPTPTRIVWMTLLAAMDEDGFAQFASPANLAHRAIVTPAETDAALACLEAPDPNSSDPTNEGRRIERVPGGWMVLNAEKYRDLVTRETIKIQTRERVRRHRDAKKPQQENELDSGNAPVTPCNAKPENVTPSDTDTDTVRTFDHFWSQYPNKKARQAALKAWRKLNPGGVLIETIMAALAAQRASEQWQKDRGAYVPHASTWLNGRRWEDEAMPIVAGAAPRGELHPAGWRRACCWCKTEFDPGRFADGSFMPIYSCPACQASARSH